MSSPIERFKDSYQNWRYNPFTAADMAVDKEEDGLIIPSGSPFLIQLLEQARYNDPSSVVVRCYGVDTFVDETSASGQPILKVDDTAGFSPADTIIINRGGDREEERIIDTIQAGISLTVTVNLTFEHTAGQADVVEKYIAFTETAGAPAQSQFRVDYPPGDGGEGTGLVEFNTNDADKEVRINYKATGSPALAETLDTKISYPAETPGDDQFVGFDTGAPIWRDFSHANLTGRGADDHHAQAHSLASHSTKAHGELTGVGINDHHAKSHAALHHSGGADALALASIAGFSTYLNQAVKTNSSPKFYDLLVGYGRAADSKITWYESSTARAKIWFDISLNDFIIDCLQDDLGLESASYIRSETTRDNTTGAAASMVISAVAGTFSRSTSARRYKQNIKGLELDLSGLNLLRPVSFDTIHKNDRDKKGRPHLDFGRRYAGLIAEDVEKVYPDLVIYNDKKEAEDYDTKMLSTLMLALLQRHEARIKKLEP